MQVAVGSTNPVKVEAVREVFRKAFREADVFPVDVPSGVSRNPFSEEETLEGASRRAREACATSGADLGVGLEGGLRRFLGKTYTCVWCAVWDGERAHLGGGVHLPIPDSALRRMEAGRELGEAMDEIGGERNSKRKMGAEGILTGGLIDRRESFLSVIRYAIAPLVRPDLYGGRQRP